MGDELKWLLKQGGGGRTFESYDISLENMFTLLGISLALLM